MKQINRDQTVEVYPFKIFINSTLSLSLSRTYTNPDQTEENSDQNIIIQITLVQFSLYCHHSIFLYKIRTSLANPVTRSQLLTQEEKKTREEADQQSHLFHHSPFISSPSDPDIGKDYHNGGDHEPNKYQMTSQNFLTRGPVVLPWPLLALLHAVSL